MTATVLAFVVSVGVMPADTASAQDLSPPVKGGAARVESQDPALAAALFRVSQARTPERLVAVGDRYYDLGIRDRAMEFYAESLRRDRRFVAALDGAARTLRDWGQLAEALGHAHRATYFAPGSPVGWNTLGTILQALDRPQAAAQAYRRAIAVDGTAVYARSNLCYLALIEGDMDTALDQCRAALILDEGFAPARNNLGLLFAAAGDGARASEMFTVAAGEAAGHFNTGLVLLAKRDYATAVRAFEAAYRIDPELAPAHRFARLARWASRQFMEIPNGHRSR